MIEGDFRTFPEASDCKHFDWSAIVVPYQKKNEPPVMRQPIVQLHLPQTTLRTQAVTFQRVVCKWAVILLPLEVVMPKLKDYDMILGAPFRDVHASFDCRNSML